MSQYHSDPTTYLDLVTTNVPSYVELQQTVADAATTAGPVRTILELGIGTGETARHVLARHPQAHLVGIDGYPPMLDEARRQLPADTVELRLQRLQDPLPEGPFDLVVSALAVHHLASAEKQDLFRRVHAALRAGGRFVLADLVVPDDPADAVTPMNEDVDRPDRAADQVEWLTAAGFDATIVWARPDLVVLNADRAR